MQRRRLLGLDGLVMLLSVLFCGTLRAQSIGTMGTTDGDRGILHDPMRPVMEIGHTHVVLQYFTATPCETRVQIRASNLPATAWRPPEQRQNLWQSKAVRLVQGEPGIRTYHRIRIDGLKPGTRYYYRIYDPGAMPTREERAWGADPPWRREYAVATLAPRGYKTIIHLPVKVLMMPNVVNVASAYADPNNPAPPPPALTKEQIERIKQEYAMAARYFWVNSGMRLWVDFHIFVDDRWQRWGEEPSQAQGFYKGLPPCRSYAGVDFAPPGGGAFTIVDTRNPQRVNHQPVYEEMPYAGQIEQAFPRRWDPQKREWVFYNSGGGTFGVDGFPDGIPARSQFLGGGDTAWLVTHEFHHQLESYSAFSLSHREDERIVFNHPEPRYRRVNPDGSVAMNPWNTAGRHGEHWNVMAYWDRTLSDAQWLRLYFGEAITVRDADNDGFPDDDPRLPLDEKRFGTDPRRAMTDGQLNDLRKAMLSTWAPAPLQFTFTKPSFLSYQPDPHHPDSDRDGLPDGIDPYPLYPWQPFVWFMRATVDGVDTEWASVPPTGERAFAEPDITIRFKHAHDGDAYYGCFRITGAWRRLYVVLDGEGRGVFSGEGVVGFEIINGAPIELRPTGWGAPGIRWKATQQGDRSTLIEFSIPNGGESKWYWWRGGREIGVAVDVWDPQGRGYSLYEPYDLFYCRMVEPVGQLPPPADAPAELTAERATRTFTPANPNGLKIGAGWRVEGDAWVYEEQPESLLLIEGLNARHFDLWMEFEAQQDGVLAAFLPSTTEMNAGRDYVVFVGGYGNTITRFRLFGREEGDSPVMMHAGKHRLQLSRHNGQLWALFDGKPILWARDPNPNQPIGKLAVIGGYNGKQRVYQIRYRVEPE